MLGLNRSPTLLDFRWIPKLPCLGVVICTIEIIRHVCHVLTTMYDCLRCYLDIRELQQYAKPHGGPKDQTVDSCLKAGLSGSKKPSWSPRQSKYASSPSFPNSLDLMCSHLCELLSIGTSLSKMSHLHSVPGKFGLIIKTAKILVHRDNTYAA